MRPGEEVSNDGYAAERAKATPVNLTPFTVWLLLLTGVGAGAFGSMLGIGGGVLIIPALVLGFDVPVHVAVATSLVAVIATSSAATSVYVGRGLTNMRLGMTLELATTLGGIAGGLLAATLPAKTLLIVFALFLVPIAVLLVRGKTERGEAVDAPAAARGRSDRTRRGLGGVYYNARTDEFLAYETRNLPIGMGLSLVAGGLSGLLGVGGGILKVPAMNLAMGIPLRVAAATSNFMIGVTAAASLVIYVQRGLLDPLISAPVALGVTGGALVGTYIAPKVSSLLLARIFAVLLALIAVQTLLRALGVGHG
jgi:uncharacterized protein